MIKPTIPENEAQRIKELFKYNILDTPPEDAFDEITRLASSICGTSISLVSLVDKDRQWFKSKIGLDLEETSRDVSFCAHAIQDTKIMEIENATEDKRFKDNPLVTADNGIRFYAGMPLQTPGGHNIGTLCVIDSKPKKLNKEQREALQTLGKQVIKQMELSLKIREIAQANQQLAKEKLIIEKQHNKITESIAYAKKVQNRMLSSWNSFHESFPQSCLFFRPKDMVSGDFYFCQNIEDKYILAVGDCTGHGVAGALLSILSHELLKEIIVRNGITDSNLILQQLHTRFLDNVKESSIKRSDALDISLCVIDPNHQTLSFSGAKNHLYYSQKDGKIEKLSADRIRIGEQKQDQAKFSQQQITYNEYTRIYLFTDGFPDQFGGPDGKKKFTRKKLLNWLQNQDKIKITDLQMKLPALFEEWKGDFQQIDDVTVIGFEPYAMNQK